MKIDAGKLNIVFGGQFGSEGKGLLSSYIATRNKIDICITTARPNAGHTFYKGGKKIIVHHLPVAAFFNPDSIIFLNAESVIDLDIFEKEVEESGISKDRIYVHPRASVLTRDDILEEHDMCNMTTYIASTQSGTGACMQRKIARSACLAMEYSRLDGMIWNIPFTQMLNVEKTALLEVPQGMDLGLNHGFEYPHCTTKDITIGSALNDVGLHPHYLGKVAVCIRTYPIRVGHLLDRQGRIVGHSGPFQVGSKETTWEEIGVEPEKTTNTRRIRRVATFSEKQYQKMLTMFRPDYVLLNFANYFTDEQTEEFLRSHPEVTHLGYGPKTSDIFHR